MWQRGRGPDSATRFPTGTPGPTSGWIIYHLHSDSQPQQGQYSLDLQNQVQDHSELNQWGYAQGRLRQDLKYRHYVDEVH